MNSSLEEIASKPGVLELIKALSDIAEKIERRPRLVGAIANPATTHDTFYSLLFGEVDDVLYRLKELEKTLPELNQGVLRAASAALSEELAESANRLETVAEAFLLANDKAHGELQQIIKSGKEGIKAYADHSAQIAGKQAKLDVQNAAREVFDEINPTIEAAFSKHLGEVVRTMKAGIQRQAEATRTLRKWGIITAAVLIVVQLGIIGFTVFHNSGQAQAAPVPQQYQYRR